MYFWNSKTSLFNCVFTQNTAGRGGGIHIGGSSLSPTIANCIFTKNIATSGGSAIYNIRRPVFLNCTVWGNRSTSGSNTSSVWSGTGNFYFRNCIVYDNNGGFVNGTSQVHISYSLVQGMTSTSGGNINGNTNPLFTDPENGDFSLQSDSPVINQGNNSFVPSSVTTDIAGNLRIIDCVVDLGAYERASNIPSAPSPQTFSAVTTVADLAATGNNLKWYDAPTGGMPLELSDIITAGTYYVTQTIDDCESFRTAVEVITSYPIRYVKPLAIGSGDGSSWGNASDDLQLMINQSSEGNQIFVAGGTYKPIRPADDLDTIDLNNRKNAFVLKNEVKVYGGFAGTETSLEERDLSNSANKSILSGDFNDDDVVTGSASSLTITGNDENAYRVVINIGNNSNTLLDSFTIQGANSVSAETITVNGVTFTNSYGGGMYFWDSKTTLFNCIFTQNTAGRGGGIHIGGSSLSPTIANCIFVKNIATSGGSAIYNIRRPVFLNCTVWGNRSTGSNTSSVWSGTGNFYFRNCIVYDNSGGFVNGTSQVHISYSLVQGMTSTSDGNINGNTNPLFTDPENGDFSLQSDSPVINQGNNSFVPSSVTTDIAGNLRIQDCTVDLGAYESDSAIISIDKNQGLCEESSLEISPIIGDALYITDFTEEFSSENWQSTSFNSDGSITFSPGGTSLQMISSNNNSNTSGYNQVIITASAFAVISFDWSYSTYDAGGVQYDYPKFILNGVESDFQGFNTFLNQSGTHTLSVNEGDVFGFKIISQDNIEGPATVNITNFVISNDFEYQWTASDGGVINGADNQLTLTVDTAGTYTLTAITANGCIISKTIEVTAIPKADAPEGDAEQTLLEGQTLADLEVTGENLTWYTDEELTIQVTDTAQIIFGTTYYYVTQTIEGCESEALMIVVKSILAGNCDSYTVWNGTSWNNGTPNITKRAIIEGDLTLVEDLIACEVLLNSGVFTVSSGVTLTVSGIIENTQSEVNFIVQNNANLIQIDDVENIGEITVYRNSSNIKHLDYTLWSSPVAEQGLRAFSPQTLWYRIYDYNATTDQWNQIFGNSSDDDVDFQEGVGYMFRSPNNFVTTPYTYNGEFKGVPNNGNVTVTFNELGTYQGVGNPYPSNISIQQFKNVNGTGALYFWTNTNAWNDSIGNYVGNNWAIYNGVGGVAAANDNKAPNAFIPVGQGFVFQTAANSVTFTNAMRTSNEGVFFKTMDEGNHRLWLNLSDDEQILNQTLIGYTGDATQGLDFGIDAKLFSYSGSALYSLIENVEDDFVIQGRALPFDDNDVVPLGFRANEAGNYTISLADFDGIFAEGQDIYLRDNFTQTEQNLKNGNYSFVSEQGIFNTRFEMVYKQSGTLDITNPDLNNSWVVYKQNDVFHIYSRGFEMKEVMVYDVLGRVVYSCPSEGNSHILPNLGANQVLIVKIITTENEALSKKVQN